MWAADNMDRALRSSWQTITSSASSHETPSNIIHDEEKHFSNQHEQCKQKKSFFYHEEHIPAHRNETLHIISSSYIDHDYIAPKQMYQESWLHHGQTLSLDIDHTSVTFPHPAPQDSPPCYSGHCLPLSIPSPCSPQSIADATMTELTELSPVFSIPMENFYNDFTDHNLDILADAFNTALSDASEEKMFNIQPVSLPPR